MIIERFHRFNRFVLWLTAALLSAGLMAQTTTLLALLFPVSSSAQTFPSVIEVSELDGSDGFELLGAAAGDQAGTSVAGPGDLNEDGFVDVVIGAPFNDNFAADAGMTYVLFGGTDPNLGFSGLFLSGLNGTMGFGLSGRTAGERSGSAVSAAGDVNEDGQQDLAIGAPFADDGGEDSGNAYVVYGDDGITGGFAIRWLIGLDGEWGVGFRGAAAGDMAGASVTSAGDLNADGVADLVIGAPGASPSGATGAGAAHVVFGGTDFGGGFSILFLSGLDGENGFALLGNTAGDAVGTSVTPIGDLNDDGLDDLTLGAPGADPGNTDSGRSYVITGDPDVNGGFASISLAILDGVERFAFTGEAPGDRSGVSVASAGDLNADGVEDLVIGAPERDGFGIDSGSAYIVFGNDNVSLGFGDVFLSGLDGVRGFELLGVAGGDRTGAAAAPAGDLNGDGIDDLVVGAPGASANGPESGSAFVLFGGSDVNLGFSGLFLSGLNGERGFRIDGAASGDRFGSSVAAVGDLNGDGFDDLVVGAPERDASGNDSGSAYVIFGREAPLFADGFESS